jgi:hypothetical protein
VTVAVDVARIVGAGRLAATRVDDRVDVALVDAAIAVDVADVEGAGGPLEPRHEPRHAHDDDDRRQTRQH